MRKPAMDTAGSPSPMLMRPPPTHAAPVLRRAPSSKHDLALPNFPYLSTQLLSPTKQNLLVILDVHGVLLERARRSNRSYKLAMSHRPPWQKVAGHYVWLRPHLERFLSILTTRFRVAAWSSATVKSIPPLITALTASMQLPTPLDQRLEFLWMRDSCRRDTSLAHGSLKYLPDVWDSGLSTVNDTLILDDSPRKVRYTPASALIIPEYSVERLGCAYNNDDSLLWMLLYIEYIACKIGTEGSLEAARRAALGFEDFVVVGKARAKSMAKAPERESLESLALFFLNTVFERESSELVGGSAVGGDLMLAVDGPSEGVDKVESSEEGNVDTGKPGPV